MKTNFAILIDSTGDLSAELRQKYDIDYIRFTVSIEGGDYVIASLDYDQGLTHHDFYQVMRDGKRIYTSQVTEQECFERITPFLKDGKDVLYIACSSGLSASVGVASRIAETLMKEYPGRKVVAFDSLISGYAQGSMAIKASQMREEGKTIDEVVAFLTENRQRFNQFASVKDLTALKKAGRVTASSAFFGNIFSVKPILISDIKGHNLAIEKVKGRKASLIRIADMAVDACLDPENETFYVANADCEEEANIAKEEILRRLPTAKIVSGNIGPIIGASTGPGTVSVYVYGKEVTACGE